MDSHGKRILGIVASIAALAFSASLALAQDGGSPDGSSAQAQPAPLAATAVGCGAMISSVVRTQNSAISFTNTGFLTLPGAVTTVGVPSGQTRCIKVLFTVEAAASRFCYVRALDNGFVMNPDGGGFQALVSVDGSANAHAYEWVRRVGPGSHTIFIQRRVDAGTCFMDDWTFDVQVHG